MSVLSTSEQAGWAALFVIFGLAAAALAILTDSGPQPPARPITTNAAGSGSEPAAVQPAQAARPGGQQSDAPPALSGAESYSPRLDAAGRSLTSRPAARGEGASEVGRANDPVLSRGQDSVGRSDPLVPPGAVASSEAGGGIAPPPASEDAATGARTVAEKPRPKSAAELTRGLSATGHRVHAAISGDAQSATLSVTGATLTKEDALRWVGAANIRRELRAAGVRVVVVVGGAGSWTFML